MKKLLFVGLLALVGSRAFADGVFISEYIEGSGSNKALEIYNGTGAAIDLSEYRFNLSSNGSTPGTMYTFTGTLADGDVFVVANASANAAILAVADITSNGFANWNGNDFVGLYHMVDTVPVLIDVIGVQGVDPGAAGWAVAGTAGGTKDHTLQRKAAITQGNTDWALSAGTDASSSEWVVLNMDDFSNIGSPTVDSSLPVITGLDHAPLQPTSSDAVTVSANVTDTGTLTAVNMLYTVNGGAAVTVAMTLGTPPSYSAVIPAQADLAAVDYHVEATDNDANTTISGTGSYVVHDSFPCGDLVAIRTNDANGVPLMVNQSVSVCGVLTMRNELDPTRGPIYITGDTGSIALYGLNVISSGALIGDEIQATGIVKNFNGLNELDPVSFIEIVGSPGEPTPVPLTLAQILVDPESYEAQFVTLTGLELDPASVPLWPAVGVNGTVTVLQGTDSFPLFIDRDTNIDGTTPPAGQFTLRALIGQYDTSSPYTSGHQFIPRSLADIIPTGNQPPSVTGVAHTPYVPTAAQSVTVSATITDDVTVASASLFYQVNGGGYSSVAMTEGAPGAYTGVISAQADGSLVEYYVSATDDLAETTTSVVQSYTVYNTFPCADIATIRVNDANGIPVMVNQTVYVCGTVTASNQFDPLRGAVFLTGSTGSIAIYGYNVIESGLTIGDAIQVIGVVKNFQGLNELDPVSYVAITGHPGEPTPVPVTLAQLLANGEGYEAQFVRLTNLTLDPLSVWPAAGVDGTVTVLQGTDSFTLFIDKDTNIDDNPAPTGAFDLVCLISQRDTASPFDTGYQLMPRFITDFTPVVSGLDAPVVTITYNGALVTLSWAPVAGATDYRVFTSVNGYSDYDAGTLTGGATGFAVPAVGRSFFKVVALN